ncbi:phosphoglyceromutase [Nitzschia inconspicua]|uniref:Phosphoglyceromutase n=1 Tax=Nitzschia inconspicua TaxID=303405 RepID=A0A9K3Q724_9STRA|nr:phosphoglyceromutase [Nitzschia inconspicua]
MRAAKGHNLVKWVSLKRRFPSIQLTSNFATHPDSSNCPNIRKLIVVRHGETEWNRSLRIQGVTDVPLNQTGDLQAKASAQALLTELQQQETRPTVIHSSKMCRASDTAQAIADALNESAVANDKTTISVSQYGELNEWNLGVLEGLRKEEARAQYPDAWKIFSEWADPLVSVKHANTTVLGGESMEDLRLRAATCLEGLIAGPNDDSQQPPVIVVTHGGVLGQLLRHALVAQYPLDQQESIRKRSTSVEVQKKYHRPKNACITKFDITVNPETKEWTIIDWANDGHLDNKNVTATLLASFLQVSPQVPHKTLWEAHGVADCLRFSSGVDPPVALFVTEEGFLLVNARLDKVSLAVGGRCVFVKRYIDSQLLYDFLGSSFEAPTILRSCNDGAAVPQVTVSPLEDDTFLPWLGAESDPERTVRTRDAGGSPG